MRGIHLGIIAVLTASFGQASAQKPAEDVCRAANQALAQHQFEAARTGYEACLKQTPPSFENLSNLGMTYAQLGHFDQAIAIYNQALALDPGNPTLHMNMGLAYMKAGRAAEATAEFARTLMVDLNNPKAEELLAFSHYQNKQYELAAVEAERVCSAKPDEASAEFLLGSAYLKLGLFRQAIPFLYDAAQKTNSAGARVVLGEAFLGVKAYKEALAEFNKALAAAPETPGLHADLGTTYAGLGRTSDAVAEYQKELARDPNNFEADYYLGRLKRLGGEPEESKRLLTKAEQLRPGDPSVGYEYAVFAMEAKDYARAEALLRSILQRLPAYMDAHVLLTEVYFKTKRPDDARREKAIVEALRQADQERVIAEGKAIEEAHRRQQNARDSQHP
jgi:tetratricopeptide (TPR) repeat protein